MRRTGWISAGIATLLVAMNMAVPPEARAGDSPSDIVDRFQNAYREGSVQGMLDLYADDATFEDVNQRHRFSGHEELQALLSGIVAMHLTMDIEESRRIVDGSTVAVEYAYKGQLNGAALGASVGKEGCPSLDYALPTTSWFTVRDGRIVDQKDFIDWATFLDLRQEILAAGSSKAREN